MVPPKLSISEYMGIIKGRTAIRVFNKFSKLKKRPYWGNHFWSRGYCIDTVGLDAQKIRQYVEDQEAKERQAESKQQRLFLFNTGQRAFLFPEGVNPRPPAQWVDLYFMQKQEMTGSSLLKVVVFRQLLISPKKCIYHSITSNNNLAL